MDETLHQWFMREIIPHERSLVRFMGRVTPNREEVADLRQEVYIRVYEAAARSRPLRPKSFLFATARHLMADRVRRGKIVSIEAKADVEAFHVLIDEISPEQNIRARQELRQLGLAFELLPMQCREVMWMRKVEELSQKEVARRLGINEKAVEKRLARSVRLLAEACSEELPVDKRNRKVAFSKNRSGHG